MKKFKYVGPIDQIDTVADGRVYTVSRGDIIEVSPYAAEALRSQPSNWEEIKPSKKKDDD